MESVLSIDYYHIWKVWCSRFDTMESLLVKERKRVETLSRELKGTNPKVLAVRGLEEEVARLRCELQEVGARVRVRVRIRVVRARL